VPGASIRYLPGGGPDPRCYRVDCGKLTRTFPGFETRWNVRRGAQELYDSYRRNGLTAEMFGTFMRLHRIQQLMTGGHLDASLYWQAPAAVA
jgi:hypothetical protein